MHVFPPSPIQGLCVPVALTWIAWQRGLYADQIDLFVMDDPFFTLSQIRPENADTLVFCQKDGRDLEFCDVASYRPKGGIEPLRR